VTDAVRRAGAAIGIAVPDPVGAKISPEHEYA
jgi:hypothetical protein